VPATDGPLELALSVGEPGKSEDHVVTLARDAMVSELVAGLGESAPLLNARTETVLDPRASVIDSDLRSGDRLVAQRSAGPTAKPRARAPRAAFEVRVVGGPGAGSRRALTQPKLTVGRSSTCDLPVDDRSISRHHLTLHFSVHGVAVEDAGSSNGTAVEGVALQGRQPRQLAVGEHVALGRTLLSVHKIGRTDDRAISKVDARLNFNRPPRVRPAPATPRLRLGRAPDEPRPTRVPWVVALAPLVLGVGFAAITGQVAMLAFAALTPVMVLGTFVSDRRGGRQDHTRAVQQFHAELAGVEQALANAQLEEIEARRRGAPDPATLVARALEHEPELWERRPRDEDFLELRVGAADQPSRTSVEMEPGGNETLRAQAAARVGRYTVVPSVPATVPLTTAGTLGISGDAKRVQGLARWLVAQAVTLHSPRDLVVSAAVPRKAAKDWEWLKWLPHLGADSSPLLGAHAAVGSAGTIELLRAIVAVQEARGTQQREGRTAPAPWLLLLLDETVVSDRALVSRLLAGAPETGVADLWMGSDRRELPGECGVIAHLDAAVAWLSLIDARSGQVLDDVSADGVSLDVAVEVARALQPVSDASADAGAAGLPARISLLKVLPLQDRQADGVLARWARHRPAGALAAPIGVSSEGPHRVDLRADGPHALIAGTTGAGKSELLQTMVAALAATHPPDRLSFLLVDYKGGTAFRDCSGLPHAVGMVTDLDEHLAQRALVSLNAELRRREHILREAGANDLLDMERRDADRAPPSLVIVIDEFAALAREVPAFVDGVVDIAQRGRALGLHLVLATQRPSGVISESIKANTNLRIALRVASPPDSEDVIASKDAALVSRELPGRAYARVGHNELAVFQAAYGGRPMTAGDRARVVVGPFRLVRESRDGAPAASHSQGASQLQWLVEAVTQAAERSGIAAPAAPWLPELPAACSRSELSRDWPEAQGVFGLVDDPARQRRLPLTFDPTRDGSMLVFGAAGAGKSTLLRTLACVLAERSSPEDLWVYVLDFASRGLAGIEALPQCGTVVVGSDEERIARLLALLRRTVEERRRAFAQAGVLTVEELRKRTEGSVASIVVLVHDYGAFVSAYERVSMGAYLDAVPTLVSDGRAVGVRFVITADRRSAVPPSLLNTVARRLVLRMAAKEEYTALGLDERSAVSALTSPGRGFTKEGLEFQIAVEGERHEADAQLEALAALGQRLRDRHGAAVAPGIAALPAVVEIASLPSAPADRPLRPVVGVSDEPAGRFDAFRPLTLDLEAGHLLVAGPYRSGRSTVLATLATSLAAGTGEAVELHLLSPRTRTTLHELGVWTSVARGTDARAPPVPASSRRWCVPATRVRSTLRWS
jgi:S-DNA-T family DNA segregation ATPase FtsK/SpoIIIE